MYYKFIISALNTEKIINKLINKFDIFNIQKNTEFISFYCKIKYIKKIKKILENAGFIIQSGIFVGFFYYLKKIFSVGIIIGIIFSFIFYFISSFFITNILIIGNISFCGQEVFEVLKKNNIKNWSTKSSIDIQMLEKEIKSIDYISYVSIIIKGNSLVINLKEQLTNTEVVNIGEYLPLVSLYDCKITSIKIVQGTPKVKVGDIVHIGQILVEPYVIGGDDKMLSVQPLADICGDVWLTSDIDYYDTKVVNQRTGNVIRNFSITFMDLPVYEKNDDINFQNYQVEESEEYISSTLLPIKIKHRDYYEYNIIAYDINFEENKQQFIEQTRQTCLLNLNKYDIIKSESFVINNNNGFHTISYTITLNRKIC